MNLLAITPLFHNPILSIVFLCVAFIIFVLCCSKVIINYPLIALGLAFLTAAFLAGCAKDPQGNPQAWTPEQAAAYSNAAHTVVHGAVSDYKEVKAATH